MTIQKIKCSCGLWRQVDGTVAAYSHKYRRKCDPLTPADRAAINEYQRTQKKKTRKTPRPETKQQPAPCDNDPYDIVDWSAVDPQAYYDFLAGKRDYLVFDLSKQNGDKVAKSLRGAKEVVAKNGDL